MVNRFLYQLDRLMSPCCFICQQNLKPEQSHFGFCRPCLALLTRPDFSCLRCGLALNSQAIYCAQCLQKTPYFDRCHYAWTYQEPLKSLIKKFKYQAQWQLGRQLSRVFSLQQQSYLSDLQADLAIAVPMFYQRQQLRGANHANVIARQLAYQFNWHHDDNRLYRQKATKALFNLNAQQRRKELKHAFTLLNTDLPAHIVLIDDVITSGSTMNEISYLLKKSGCRQVSILALCRTPLGES